MSGRKPGDVFCLKVRTSFPHFSGRADAGRFVGLPCLQIRLSARPPSSSLLGNLVRWVSSSGTNFAYHPRIEAIVDTGATRCIISSLDAYGTFSLLRGNDLSGLKGKDIYMPNGATMNGRILPMEMQVEGLRGTWEVPFVISDTLQAPVLLSWKQLQPFLPPVWALERDSLTLADVVSK